MKYPVALFIGRFQPFHKGHLWEVKEALKRAEKVIVGIGSSNLHDEKNPFEAEQRLKMVEAAVEEAGLAEAVVKIVLIPDTVSDQEWVKLVLQVVNELGYVKSETLVVGNNDWVNELLAKQLMPICETGLYQRDELEGTKIRELMRTGDESWQTRVPEAVVRAITSLG